MENITWSDIGVIFVIAFVVGCGFEFGTQLVWQFVSLFFGGLG